LRHTTSLARDDDFPARLTLAGVTLLLTLVHVGLAALWIGAMAYSLFVAQPAVARTQPDPVRAEEYYREFATGNRWRVVAIIAALAASGGGLVMVASGRSATWWLLIGAKTALLAVGAGIFWWVSWRGWPRRIFALPAEIPAEQARFRRVALALMAVVGLAFVLGVVAAHP